jgi:myosin heavy subunit
MGWVTAFSNGEFLFFNTDTSEVTDNCPPELQDEDGSYLWISHDEEIYFPGKFSIKAHSTSLENEMISIENINGNAMSVPNSALGESIPSIRSLLKFPNDLIEMDSISPPAVYFTLRARFLQDQIYTSLGDILLIVNPFKTIPNPSMETISSVSSRDKLPPHPYLTAAMAYEKMRQTLSNQTILIGGESGSGKTETTKTCLSYLSHLSSQMTSPAVTGSSAQLSEVKNTHVEERIMASNPILEAFGNAKTIRNDNSSRFGKFLEIIYSPKGEIASCRTTSYLLEKCRVHRQNSGERNFHIFYQICRAVEGAITSMNEGRRFSEHHTRGECSSSVLDDENFLSNLNLFSLDDYDILTTSGCINIEGVNDCHSFLETEAAARTLGFSTQSVQLLISTCVAILHLGNIQFVDVTDSGGTESCVIGGTDEMVTQRSTASLELAAELLGIDSLTLSTALRVRKLVIRGEQTDVQLSSSQAKEARDSICKALYSNLFDWIVQNVTVTFAETNALPPPQSKGTFIGILDIFGFEIFDINYFEQASSLAFSSLIRLILSLSLFLSLSLRSLCSSASIMLTRSFNNSLTSQSSKLNKPYMKLKALPSKDSSSPTIRSSNLHF